MESPYWGEGIMSNSVMPQATSLRTGKAALRSVRKLERPRPLKLVNDSTSLGKQIIESGSFSRSSTDEVLQEVETVVKHINNGNFDGTVSAAIIRMCNQLRSHGTQLETKFKDQLDRYFVSFRNACREEKLDMACRLRLLEIIELRAMGWRFNENLTNYYKRKVVDSDQITDNAFSQSTVTTATLSLTTPSLTPAVTVHQNSMFFQPLVPNIAPASTVSYLAPGEVIKSSGKFAKPTKIPGKNYYKDEIVIRNSDSGKVMGIKGRRVHMIEEFSDTVISFQRVSQGAKDRLVQITGPKEESIERSKQLIEETIRRNASPVRDTPKELFGSDSCSSLNSNNSEEGNSNIPPHLNCKGHLLHSLSMNDASIGEYQYTVTVGRDTLKISGAKLDIVRTAKLVLEEYFAGDAERSKHDASDSRYGDFSEPVFITTGNEEYSEFSEGNMCSDGLIPVQQSPASSDIKSYLECNGCSRNENDRMRHLSSSSSDSEEGTFKANDNLSFSESESGVTKENYVFPMDSPNSPALSSSGTMTVIREPLFPNSSKEAFQLAESAPNFQSLCAKVRRAKFAKTTEQLKDKAESPTPPSPSTPVSSCGNVKLPLSSSLAVESTGEIEDTGAQLTRKSCLVYTRDFLLSCAASPFSRVTPKDFSRIIREAPYVLRKTPEHFDPVSYKKQETSACLYPVLRSNSSVIEADYDEIV